MHSEPDGDIGKTSGFRKDQAVTEDSRSRADIAIS